MTHDHDHSAATGRRTQQETGRRVAITASVLIAEVVGAIITGSLALLADAGHMLTDAAGLTIARW